MKIDLEKFICSLLEEYNFYPEPSEEFKSLINALKQQGLSYKNGKIVEIEPKQEWSEEDEEILKDIITDVKFEGYNNDMQANSYKKINWLKKLKDRVYPKQEWKQENTDDLTDFENAMMHIGGSFFGENAGLDPNDTNAIKEQANILLELVPKQKWSEEDEYHKRQILRILKDNGCSQTLQKKTEKWIEEKLKSIRPQSHWKPSEQQLKTLQVAIDIIGEVTLTGTDLKELLEQLKKLRG